MPGTAAATLKDGSGDVGVALASGEVATSELTSTPLTREEIVDAGIDPDAPGNSNVFEFSVHLNLDSGPGEVALHGYVAEDTFGRCPTAAEDPLDIVCPKNPEETAPPPLSSRPTAT